MANSNNINEFYSSISDELLIIKNVSEQLFFFYQNTSFWTVLL